MDITFKLFATLTDYLPPSARRSNVMNLEVDDDVTIAQVIEPFGMPEKLVHLVLVNGTYIPPEDRATKVLVDGDVLAIWPPIAGGWNRTSDGTVQAFYEATFSREMGCTEVEWLGWLPAAMGTHHWQRNGQSACVDIQNADGSQGQLNLRWQEAQPRRIALISIPRLLVSFQFEGLNDGQRYTFMRRFDLYMQRGGG